MEGRRGPGQRRAGARNVRILVLYAYPPGLALRPAVERHLHTLDGRGDELLYHNAMEGSPRALGRLRPDAVVLHTTFLCLRWFEDFDGHRSRFAWLGALDCPKLALPQDEYDHSEVLDEWLREVGVTHVYSNFGPDVRGSLYPVLEGEAEFRHALTGYVDDDAVEWLRGRARPLRDRPYDIVYRATQLPYWFGSHGQLKHRIGLAAQDAATAHGLAANISMRPEDTILGAEWWDFLGSGRVVIGCESGSSVLDRRGEVQGRIRRLLALQPGLSFEEVSRRMPQGWDSWSFFAISPRHLEAVLTKTAQVLVEGSYDGVLVPNRHYLPLRRDLADLDEVLERVRDVDLLEELTEQAYEDVVLGGQHTYAAFAARLRADLQRAGGPEPSPSAAFALPRRRVAPARAHSLAANAVAAASLLSRSGSARKLMRTREVAPAALLRDLVQLEHLRRAAASDGATASVGGDTGQVTILVTTAARDQTETGDAEVAEALERGASIVWLHGSGAGGLRRFEALSALAPRHPREVAGLLGEIHGVNAHTPQTARR